MPDSPSTYALFYHKRDSQNLYPAGVQPINIHYEKQFYGKVDTKQSPVMVKDLNFLKNIPGSDVMALDFVTEAFIDLQKHFNKAMAFNRITKFGNLSNGIVPVRGYADVNLLYADYLGGIYDTLVSYLFTTNNDRKIKKYTDFLQEFFHFIDIISGETVFSRTAFIKSRLCPVNSSGLVIDISDDSFSDDDVRDSWIEDPNFNFYRNAAIKFGFLLDRSAPWRLYANIASVEMQKYWGSQTDSAPHRQMLMQSPGGASNLFDVYFIRPHNYELEQFEATLIYFYERFARENPSFRISEVRADRSCVDQTAVKEDLVVRENIASPTDHTNILMKLFFQIRLREEQLHERMPQQKFNNYVRYANRLMKKVDKFAAMRYINNKIKNLNSLKESENLMACQNYESCDQVNKSSLVDYTYVKD